MTNKHALTTAEQRDGIAGPRWEGWYRVRWSNGVVSNVWVECHNRKWFYRTEKRTGDWIPVGDGHFGRWWPV